jgi:hypothetical protein
MWSGATERSKVGISNAPHARASQIRGEREDPTVRLVTCWNIAALGPFISVAEIELHLHGILRLAGLQPESELPSEWFESRWPAVVAFIEQFAQLWAFSGFRMLRMPGNHG